MKLAERDQRWTNRNAPRRGSLSLSLSLSLSMSLFAYLFIHLPLHLPFAGLGRQRLEWDPTWFCLVFGQESYSEDARRRPKCRTRLGCADWLPIRTRLGFLGFLLSFYRVFTRRNKLSHDLPSKYFFGATTSGR